jgi:hypothetical protein
MHMAKILFLAAVLVVSAALQVNAQAPEAATQAPADAPQTPAEPPPPQTPTEKPQPPVMPPQTQTPPPSTSTSSPEGRGIFFNINIGGQSREQTFTESATFPLYNETGAVATTHAIGGSAIFDISVGMRVWRNLGVAIGYSSFKDDDDAGVTARVPHPVLFQQPRTETTTAALEHTENVVHLQFMWTIPYREKFQLALIAGPSFFTVRQDLATVQAGNIADPPPLIRSITVTNVKDSPVGFNIGADGSYRITRVGMITVGVGLFARYVSASLDLPSAAGATLDGDLHAGGFQGGGGLRLGF